MALRFDSATLTKTTRTPQGGLRCDAALTRSGIFEYRQPDGRLQLEYRPADEVFKQDSLSMFDGVPVTIGHPGLVTSKTWSKVSVGHVGAARREDSLVVAPITVQREDAVAAVESGKLPQVSVGYNIDIDPTPGEFEGRRYDCVQRNIRPNHVALIPAGTARAGRDAVLRLDSSGDEVGYTSNTMDLEKALARVAELEAESKLRQDSVTKFEAEKVVLQAKVAEQAVKIAELSDQKRLDSLVATRVDLEKSTGKVLGKDFVFAGKSDRDIKAAYVAKQSPTIRLDGKSEDFVDAAFAMALTLGMPHPSMRQVREDAQSKPPVASGIAKAQDEMVKRSQNAWKGEKS
jgi:uncharacterized protein